MPLHFRPALQSDLDFLRAMLYEAAAWRAEAPRRRLDEVLDQPRVARYLRGWGRDGDRGVIAEDETARSLGAAWFRLFDPAEPGHGFLDASIPELAVAVVPEARGRGVGTALLAKLVELARAEGFPALSLSVEKENAAARVYERAGFHVVRDEGDAWTMQLELEA